MQDEDFQRYIILINAVSNPYRSWHPVTARKRHTDEFGRTIEPGERYYQRDYGIAYGSNFKLKRESMEEFLGLIFYGNQKIKKIAEHIENKEREDLIKKLDSSEFFGGSKREEGEE